jgi:phosphate starvation-inducible PhoH-like protein
VVNGDVTQIDLPPQKVSGLVEAAEIVRDIPGIATVRFDRTDVVRHPLVQRIIQAYDRHDAARRAAAGEMPAAPHRGSDDDDAEVPDERRPS